MVSCIEIYGILIRLSNTVGKTDPGIKVPACSEENFNLTMYFVKNQDRVS